MSLPTNTITIGVQTSNVSYLLLKCTDEKSKYLKNFISEMFYAPTKFQLEVPEGTHYITAYIGNAVGALWQAPFDKEKVLIVFSAEKIHSSDKAILSLFQTKTLNPQ
jgi:hypothetical protein